MITLPCDLLNDYSLQFYGFGTWGAKLWFVGMEEGGGNTRAEVEARLHAWDKLGRKELENAPEFYPLCGVTGWHREKAKLQTTWKQLVRILLLMNGTPDTTTAILDYQRTSLGRTGGETCITELFPLPCPNSRTWLYSQWSTLPWLGTRVSYQKHLAVKRSAAIHRRIAEHKPAIVVFYGSTFLPFWSSIAGATWRQVIPGRLLGGERNGTAFFVTRHPARESDEYFRNIGRLLRAYYPTGL